MKKVVFLFLLVPSSLLPMEMEKVVYINGQTLSSSALSKPGVWDEITIHNDIDCVAAISTYKGKKITYQLEKNQSKTIIIENEIGNNSVALMFRVKVGDNYFKMICPKKRDDPSGMPTYNTFKIMISSLIKASQK